MRHMLEKDALPWTLRLRQTCTELRHRMEKAQHQVEATRLAWLPRCSSGCTFSDAALSAPFAIMNSGRTLEQQLDHECWSAGPPLPTSGRTAWTIRVDQSAGFAGWFRVGLYLPHANEASGVVGHTWSMLAAEGEVSHAVVYAESVRLCMGPDEEADLIPMEDEERYFAPPTGFPRARSVRVVGDAVDSVSFVGLKLTCIYDADAGELSFRYGEGPPTRPLAGFPKAAALCPWVYLSDCDEFTRRGDKVTFSPPFYTAA